MTEFVAMRNLKKRKYIVHDTNFLRSNEPLKRYKINGLTNACQLPNNWHKVKVTLDATAVEKYLNNRKSNIEISTLINNTQTRRDKNDVPQTNKKFSSILSGRKDAMVKLEISEDFQYDTSIQKENDEFVNLLVKQENNAIKFEQLILDDFLCQNDNIHEPFTEKVMEGVFKNEQTASEIRHEELTIGSEFKHEQFIPDYEDSELINQESNDARKEMLPSRTRRRNRQKKKCQDYDSHGNQEVAKKPRISSRVDNNSTKDSNCSNKSKKKKFLEPNPPQPPDTSEPLSKELYHCDNCDCKFSRKVFLSKHVRAHLRPSPVSLISCTNCKKNIQSGCLKKHMLLCTYESLVKCQYCLVPIKSKVEMRRHLELTHTDVLPGKINLSFLHKFWIKSLKDSLIELKREGNTEKLVNFTIKFLEIEKYWPRNQYFLRSYCVKCSITYEASISCCPGCKSKLLYKCTNCNTTSSNYSVICRHLNSTKSRCNIFISHPLNNDEEQSNAINEAATFDKPCQKYYCCDMCGYKWTIKSQLYEHIFKHMDEQKDYFTCSKCHREYHETYGKQRFKWHEDLCGISIRYPCVFCPKAMVYVNDLQKHLSTHCKEDLADTNIEDIIKYAKTFRKMVSAINNKRCNEKISTKQAASKTINDSNYYLKGSQNILKGVCVKCNSSVAQYYSICLECRAELMYRCLQCDIYFSNYLTAWIHATSTCERRILTLPMIKSINEKIQAEIDDLRQLNKPSYLLDHSYTPKIL